MSSRSDLAAASPPGLSAKSSRPHDTRARFPRNLVLDARFQFKYTGFLVGSVALIMAVSGLFLLKATNTARDISQVAVDAAQSALEESKVNARLAKQNARLADPENEDLAAVIEEDLKKTDDEASKKQSEIHRIREVVSGEIRSMKVILGLSGLLTVLVLTLAGLFVTHRIVGPVHKIKRLLRRVGTGKLTVRERLRKGDELEDLFDTFLQMTWSLSAHQRGQLVTIAATLRSAEESGASTEVIDGLRALQAQVAMSLGIERMMRRSQLYLEDEDFVRRPEGTGTAKPDLNDISGYSQGTKGGDL